MKTVVEFEMNIPEKTENYSKFHREVYTNETIEDVWAENSLLYVILTPGILEIVQLNRKNKTTAINIQAQRSEEVVPGARFSSIAGSKSYLAVGERGTEQAKRIYLLSKKGRLLDMISLGEISSHFTSMNLIHKMKFCSLKRNLFLLANSLFEECSFLAVKGGSHPKLVLIESCLYQHHRINWCFTSIPAHPGRFIMGIHEGGVLVVSICLK